MWFSSLLERVSTLSSSKQYNRIYCRVTTLYGIIGIFFLIPSEVMLLYCSISNKYHPHRLSLLKSEFWEDGPKALVLSWGGWQESGNAGWIESTYGEWVNLAALQPPLRSQIISDFSKVALPSPFFLQSQAEGGVGNKQEMALLKKTEQNSSYCCSSDL